MKKATTILLATLALQLAPQHLFAATQAYWRHEEGTAGALIPDGPNTVLDTSGNGQHMQTFSSAFDPFTSGTYTAEVPPLPLRSGLANALSIDFGPGGDNPANNDDNYTAGDKSINGRLWSALTVELAFNMQSVGPGQYQALFGKDGKPLGDDVGEIDSPVPPLKVMVRGDDVPGGIDNQLFVEWIDGDGEIHFVASGETVATGQWYHVAFTLSPMNAELWVADGIGPYELKGAISGNDFAGPAGEVIVEEPLGFTIGRGMFNNGVTDWSDAYIDEVRLSDQVLTREQFLFLAPEEPGEDADFDGDLDVDGRDFLIWQRGVGPTGTNATGDADLDNDVDDADLTIWRAQFGQPQQFAAVPEPGTLGLSFGALAAATFFSRRRLRICRPA